MQRQGFAQMAAVHGDSVSLLERGAALPARQKSQYYCNYGVETVEKLKAVGF